MQDLSVEGSRKCFRREIFDGWNEIYNWTSLKIWGNFSKNALKFKTWKIIEKIREKWKDSGKIMNIIWAGYNCGSEGESPQCEIYLNMSWKINKLKHFRKISWNSCTDLDKTIRIIEISIRTWGSGGGGWSPTLANSSVNFLLAALIFFPKCAHQPPSQANNSLLWV